MGDGMRIRLIMLVAIVAVVFSGCATTKPVWFIATPGYVETQIATREHALRREYEDRFYGLEHEIEAQRRLSNELAGLSQVIRELEADSRELQIFATELEQAIRHLPAHTIQAIVDALKAHLESLE
jgi:hypothetical protein